MKKYALTMFMAVFATSNAFGGIVTYDRLTTDDVAGVDQIFNVFVSTDAKGIDSASILINSDDTLNFSWVYSSEWNSAFGSVTPASPGPPFFITSMFLGASTPVSGEPPSVGTSIWVGILTIDTTGLADGTYTVFTDFDRETPFVGPGGISTLSFQGADDSLFGSGSFVVPEPATLALLGIGGIAVLRRRRR